jgi:hypothetical protein
VGWVLAHYAVFPPILRKGNDEAILVTKKKIASLTSVLD